MFSRLRGMAGGGGRPSGRGGSWAARGKAVMAPPAGQWRTSGERVSGGGEEREVRKGRVETTAGVVGVRRGRRQGVWLDEEEEYQ